MTDRLEQLKQVAAIDPNDPIGHYAVALELCNREQWADAVAHFSKAIEVDANYSAAYYHRARAEIRAGRGDDARETLRTGMQVAMTQGDLKTHNEMKELLDTISA